MPAAIIGFSMREAMAIMLSTMARLNMAGESAGMKKMRLVLSDAMSTEARLTNRRKGIMTRASSTVLVKVEALDGSLSRP